jgi:hypothetical protein
MQILQLVLLQKKIACCWEEMPLRSCIWRKRYVWKGGNAITLLQGAGPWGYNVTWGGDVYTKLLGQTSRPKQAARAQGVPGWLRPRIFLTFGTTRVVGRQPHAPAAFPPRGNPWYSFLEAESTPGHMVPFVTTDKIPNVTPPGIDH